MRLALLAALALTAPAAAQGPAVAPDQYEAARGEPFGEASTYIWETSTERPGAAALETGEIALSLGSDWARWDGPDASGRLIDLEAARFVSIEPGASEGDPARFINSSLYAEARRRIDIYAGLSEAGARDEIAFGPAGTFHRIWLEAAMGVAAQPGALVIEQADGVLTASHDGQIIAQAWFAPGEDSACAVEPAAAFEPMLAHLRHAAPLHPDLIAAFRQLALTPCALEFTVVSPDSPEGRTERWVLQRAEAGPPPIPPNAVTALPRAGLIGATALAGLEAARAPQSAAPELAAFHDRVLALREADDLAGAYLVTIQETHHFGPCPDQMIGSARLVCVEVNALTQAGLGDPEFERALEGAAAVRESAHATAVGRLSRFLDRSDDAGAAARILVANELIAWGAEGLQSRPDLDPAALLSEALAIDPYAPDVYWHLGRRYLEAGAPHAAWLFFDLGRELPGRDATPLLAQADLQEERIAALAPDLAPAPGSASPQRGAQTGDEAAAPEVPGAARPDAPLEPALGDDPAPDRESGEGEP
jgi:hypothetical protein